MGLDIIVIILIAANVLVSYKAFGDVYFFRKYEFHIGSIRAGEQYRMFTSAFLHADFSHLLFNMLTLYIFAPVVIAYLGSLSFIIVYLASLICGSLLTLYFHKNDYSYRAIGASGAVMGIVYAAILLEPDMTINFFIPGYVYGIGYLLYTIYGMKAKNDNIGHTAHFGGAIGGYIITLSKMPNMIYDNTLMVVLLAIPIIIMIILSKTGKL